jgi:ribosomal RNA methyltransferase Nop2
MLDKRSKISLRNCEKRPVYSRRITHLLSILKNYQKFKWSASKKYYFYLLSQEISHILGYDFELTTKFLEVIPLEEIQEFFDSNDKPRPLSARINFTRSKETDFLKNLEEYGIKMILNKKNLKSAGIIQKNSLKMGSNTAYLGGLFSLQGLSSFFSVLALSPEKGERILDLAAAPGGKTTYIGEILENTGICIANDKSKHRLKSLVSSVHRLGIENTIITNYDGFFIKYKIKGFDKVLIDAPCSGTGIISHDERIKIRKISSALLLNTTLQKRLLISAIDCCKKKKKSAVVYSTCSILVEENESIIQYALEKRKVEIMFSGLNFGFPGFTQHKDKKFNEKMKYCKRFYPHIHNIDGFFVCKLQNK